MQMPRPRSQLRECHKNNFPVELKINRNHIKKKKTSMHWHEHFIAIMYVTGALRVVLVSRSSISLQYVVAYLGPCYHNAKAIFRRKRFCGILKVSLLARISAELMSCKRDYASYDLCISYLVQAYQYRSSIPSNLRYSNLNLTLTKKVAKFLIFYRILSTSMTLNFKGLYTILSSRERVVK